MSIKLVVLYRTTNNANARRNWVQVMKEKHKAQDSFRSALRSIASGSSTWTPSTQALRICSIALLTLDSWLETKRVKSRSKSARSKSKPKPKKGPRLSCAKCGNDQLFMEPEEGFWCPKCGSSDADE